MDSLKFQLFNPDQDLHLVEPLTELLHEAYAPLAEKGMRYLATHQPASKTLERLQQGLSYLAFHQDELVGSVTLSEARPNDSCEYYRKPGVLSFGQFAIKPSFQGRGYGFRMIDLVEARAKELGASELALDTSENAHELIQMYEKRGYKLVSHVQWDVTNYRSVVMSKKL